MGVSISISITQNSQNVANNTSNITAKVTASWTNGSNNRVVDASGTPQAKGWLKIDGTTYNFASTFNDSQTSSGSKTVFTKTVNVSHASDGKKTLSCSASYTTGVSAGTVTASASKALTTIPRKSTLSVGNGTLGTQQTLTVTEQASSFTHTITASCGSASTTICTKSTSNSIKFTPPLSWASQNTTGTSVSVKYTITTYSETTNVGSNSYTKTCTIPASVKPSCSIAVTDPTSYSGRFGGFVKDLSKFKVVVTPTTSYGSSIASYKTVINGVTYSTSSSFTTNEIEYSGDVTITTTVTDKRGRSGSATKKVSVLNYSAPVISKLSVKRCNEDGSENDQGEYIQVSFSASATDIANEGLNITDYLLKYKKSSESSYTENTLDDLDGIYSLNNRAVIFPADSGSSYDIEFSVFDGVKTAKRATTASTGFTLMHWNALGNGMGIGKVSEIPEVLDIGIKTRLLGGLLYPVLPPETDLNETRTPGFYVGENATTNNYVNCPLEAGTFTLEVISQGTNGQVLQRLIQCNKTDRHVYERTYYTSAWGSWHDEWYTSWKNATLSSNFTNYYSSGSEAPKYRRHGNLVEIRGTVKPTKEIEYSTEYTDIFTLPEGYRPDTSVFTLCQGSGACIWLMQINNEGRVGFTRYRNGDTNTNASNSVWLPFHCTFLVD